MGKKVFMLLVFFLLSSQIVFAADEPVNIAELDIKRLIIEENAKTRSELLSYIDRKALEYRQQALKDVDENFRVLDDRIDDKIRKAGFKFGAIFLSGLVAGSMIVYLIRRRVEKKSIVNLGVDKPVVQSFDQSFDTVVKEDFSPIPSVGGK